MKRFIKAEDVVVLRECCECGAAVREQFVSISEYTPMCEVCNSTEGYAEIIGVEIDLVP